MNKHFSIIIFIGAVLFSCISIAQDQNESIRMELENYLGYLEAGEYEAMANQVPDAFYDTLPREDFVRIISQAFEAMESFTTIEGFTIENIGPLTEIEQTSYSIVQTATMVVLDIPKMMDFHSVTKDNIEEIRNSAVMFEPHLIKQFGEENVSMNKKDFIIRLKSVAVMIAITTDMEDWQFVNVEETYKSILLSFIPETIVNQALSLKN